MRTFKVQAFLIALWLAPVALSPGQEPGPAPGGEPPNPRARRDGFGPPFVLKDALDTDKDGKLSAEEIKAAPEALKKLDANKDGKLSAEELGWPPRMAGGPRGGGPFGGPGGPGGPGGLFGGPRGGGRSFLQRFLSRDANKDGKVTKEELPSSMHFLIQLGDQNKDGAVDAQEAEQLAKQLGLAAEPRPSP